MPFTLLTPAGPLVLSDQLVCAVVRHARRQAEMVGTCLDATGLFPADCRRCFPAAFLLELGAVLELNLWELQCVRTYLTIDLPSFQEAAIELAARAEQGPAAFEGPHATPLSRRMLQVLIECFAWEGPNFFAANIVLGEIDEDQFAQVMADFVWPHRHALARCLRNHP
jgi:hypothetical protein